MMAILHFVIFKTAVLGRSSSIAKPLFRSASRSILMLTLLVGLLASIGSAQPRQPGGVYAKVLIDEVVASYTGPPEGLHDCLRHFYRELLAPPSIQGLTIGAHWDKIQTEDAAYPAGYDFSYLDDAFKVASSMGKSVRLVITPGFDTPKWLLDHLKDCVFVNKVLQGPCGKQQFYKFPEEQRSDGDRLPLPWNNLYKSKWKTFLEGLNAKYGDDPTFVAIAVAGPVAGSDEMILPTSGNDKHKQPSGLDVNDTWEALITTSFPNRPDYVDSDQVFVDQWKDAIDDYTQIFKNVTIFLGADSGGDLPEFSPGVVPPVDPNSWQAMDCQTSTEPMSCAAKTAVLTYFIDATGSSGKATQVGGLTASSQTTPGNIGIAGVKLLTALQPSPTPLPTPILGGAAFDHPVSGARFTQSVGCSFRKNCPPLTIEAAAGNVFAVVFDQTPFSKMFPGVQSKHVSSGHEPIQYVDIPYPDLQYAETHPCEETVSAGTLTIGKSFLDQINDASYALLTMSNKPIPASLLPPRASTCVHPGQDVDPPLTTANAAGPAGTNGWFTGPVVLDFAATDNASAIAETDYSMDGGTTWKPVACDNVYVPSDGIYDVMYRSIDGAGNIEALKSIHLMIDSAAPTTIASTRNVVVSHVITSVVVIFTATDGLSGVARTEYSKNNGATWTTGAALAVTTSGSHTILYRSIDNAGNTEQARSITVNL